MQEHFNNTIIFQMKFMFMRRADTLRRGQAMIEYIIVVVALMAVIASMAALMYVLRQQSNRTLDLVASGYP